MKIKGGAHHKKKIKLQSVNTFVDVDSVVGVCVFEGDGRVV